MKRRNLFSDSMSVMSDTERYRPHYPPPVGAGVMPRPYFDHEDFLEQETRHKFDQLARLHELYQSKLALANVSNSVTYQRENSSTINVRDAPCKFRRTFAIGHARPISIKNSRLKNSRHIILTVSDVESLERRNVF